jgi:dienelactone hydrolase
MNNFTRYLCASALFFAVGIAMFATAGATYGAEAAPPHRVEFPSADGRTMLVGYLWQPVRRDGRRAAAVVMMHGRAGAYSTLAEGRYDATTLSQRHRAWGELWSSQDYVALLVDGFGPRGYPGGFPRFSYDDRPPELDEVSMRPLDAYGALAYLRRRGDVDHDRIGLQGWSNGGSATLATMAMGAPGFTGRGFRAALAFYPACRLKGAFDRGYRPYAPVTVLQGIDDEEVSARVCASLVERSRSEGGMIAIKLYPGATHDFDDPGRRRQSVEANAAAAADAINRALLFFRRNL